MTRYHTDLLDEKYHVSGRSKRVGKRFAKRKSSKASRRALKVQPLSQMRGFLRGMSSAIHREKRDRF